jgi:hypothetical protein
MFGFEFLMSVLVLVEMVGGMTAWSNKKKMGVILIWWETAEKMLGGWEEDEIRITRVGGSGTQKRGERYKLGFDVKEEEVRKFGTMEETAQRFDMYWKNKVVQEVKQATIYLDGGKKVREFGSLWKYRKESWVNVKGEKEGKVYRIFHYGGGEEVSALYERGEKEGGYWAKWDEKENAVLICCHPEALPDELKARHLFPDCEGPVKVVAYRCPLAAAKGRTAIIVDLFCGKA